VSERKFVARSKKALTNWKNGVLESEPGNLPPKPGGSACKVCGVACPAEARTIGRWRVCSAHDTQATASRAALVAELTGVRLPVLVAETASRGGLLTALVPFDQTTVNALLAGNDEPWAHGIDVETLTRQALAVIPVTEPRPCSIGPCGWCGVRLSTGWEDYGHRRSDRSPAPLCGSCSTWFDRFDAVASSWRSQRVGIQAAATNGYAQAGEEPADVPSHAERGGGDGSPWSHVAPGALRTLRLTAWSKFGGKYAPDEASARAATRWARARQAHVDNARRALDAPPVEF
jgi:hypothetical protein